LAVFRAGVGIALDYILYTQYWYCQQNHVAHPRLKN
jgi:hypothetical protein